MNNKLARGLGGLMWAVGFTVAAAAEPQAIEIRLGSYYIKPDTITVKVGGPVTLNLINDERLFPAHDLVIHAPEAGIDVKAEVAPGASTAVTFTPTQAGRYEMYCSKKPPFLASHKEKGMRGVIEVLP